MLIVDDDERTLTSSPASSVARAIAARRRPISRGARAAEGGPYDLIVCDVRLPDGSGLDLVATAIPRYGSMAALMISGLDDAALAERAIRLGAYGYSSSRSHPTTS